VKKLLPIAAGAAIAAMLSGLCLAYPQDRNPDQATFHVKVEMVVLSFTVTDSKGRYVNGLKPSDFQVYEDNLREQIATFAEGNRAPIRVLADGKIVPLPAPSSNQPSNGAPNPNVVRMRPDTMGANVFILFDTSNYMYRGFVYASDAIADFIRGLDRADSVAVYTYSRNLDRTARLERNREAAIVGLRQAVAGDDSALYNCLLLTLRDASQVPGRKVVIVFSNGPDNASVVSPEDVRAIAEDAGIPIYVISTSEVTRDPISSKTFKRLSRFTGGKSYFAKTWQKQVEAFESIREDLGNSYTLTYYPRPNPNEGFRHIHIDLTLPHAKKYRIRARPGYRPQRTFE
jgi:VWFA-related protein